MSLLSNIREHATIRYFLKANQEKLPRWFIPAIIGLAVISTSIAYVICFRVLAVAGPINLLLVTFLIPLSAIFLGVTILGERLEWNVWVGMGLIVIGLIAIDGRLLARLKPKEGR